PGGAVDALTFQSVRRRRHSTVTGERTSALASSARLWHEAPSGLMPDHRIVWKSGHAPGAQAERSAPQERLRKTERKEIEVRRGLLRSVILGPTLASTSDNDYATIFRPLLRALAARGHDILFLERTGEFATTAFNQPDYCRLEFYDGLKRLERFRDKIITADVVIVSSHLSEGSAVAQFVQKIAR